MRKTPSSTKVGVRGAGLLLVASLVAVYMQPVAHSQAGDALPFAKSYLLTGNYAVAGVDLDNEDRIPSDPGFVTRTIKMNGVPDDADILAAFLYWETITNSPTIKAQADGARFNGNPVTVVKASSVRSTPATAACFASGAQSTITMFRADVLLKELKALAKDNEQWGAKFKVLKESLEHHIQEEEGKMFRIARGVLSREDLAVLGRRMKRLAGRKR